MSKRKFKWDAWDYDCEGESMKKNDIIKFGKYDWRVLKVKKGEALIISEKVIEKRAFDEDGSTNKWKDCSLNDYLNGEFLDQFTHGEKARIAKKGVFLLSVNQTKKYFENEASMTAKDASGVTCWWWLRSPGGNNRIAAAHVHPGGSLGMRGGNVDWSGGGVRPALWLKLNEPAAPMKDWVKCTVCERWATDEITITKVKCDLSWVSTAHSASSLYDEEQVKSRVEKMRADEAESDRDNWKAKAESETKRADKWERRYGDTASHLDEVLDDNKECIELIKEKAAELQADRDHWKTRAAALENAVRGECAYCTHTEYDEWCESSANWKFAQERFMEKEE